MKVVKRWLLADGGPAKSDQCGDRTLSTCSARRAYNSAVKNEPTYRIDSVDHALHLAVLLQQQGPMRVTDAARRIGVAKSTAHRLLTMLVYRDFAAQDDDRRYVAGPVLRRVSSPEPVARSASRRVAAPAGVGVADRRDRESPCRSGRRGPIRGDRRVWPGSSRRRQGGAGASRSPGLRWSCGARHPGRGRGPGTLRWIAPASRRRRGVAARPTQGATPGLRGERPEDREGRDGHRMCDRRPANGVFAAVSMAMPTSRYQRNRLGEWVGHLKATAGRIERDLGQAR